MTRTLLPLPCLLALCALAAAASTAPAQEVPWDQVLVGPTRAKWPEMRPGLEAPIDVLTLRKETARTKVRWEEDLAAAMKAARQEDRPLFITMRCLPCRACSEFDKTVLEGGDDLDPLFRQFVTVRLTSAKDLDLLQLPMLSHQDLDVSWWGYFLSPQGAVYGVYGGRDASGDATRTSRASLIKTMKRVLDYHHDPRRASWKTEHHRPAPEAKGPTPNTLPGFESWLNVGRNREHYQAHNCVHCHQVAEIARQEPLDRRAFDKDRDLRIWPYPENVGLVLDRDDGLKVKTVRPGTPAAAAGLKAGDVLGAVGATPIFSQADFRGELHRGPAGKGQLLVRYVRDGRVAAATLDLPEGWRKTDLSWRTSIADGNIGASPGGFWPNDGNRHREKLGIPKDRMCVEPHFGFGGKPKGAAVEAGLKPGDVIVGVNGHAEPLHGRGFLTWFRLNHEPGERIVLAVIDVRTGQRREVSYVAKGGAVME